MSPIPEPAGGEGAPPLHIFPVWHYGVAYLALLVLVGATLGLSYLDLGALNNVAAMTIAASKATLVALFFMHVRRSPRLIPLVAVGGVLWLVLLFGGALADYMARGALGASGR